MIIVRTMFICLAIFLFFGISADLHTAKAQTPSSLLIRLCQAPYDIDQGFCAGYLTAMRDVMNDYSLYGNTTCGGRGVGPQQLADNFADFIDTKENHTRQPAGELSAKFMADRFGCQ